MPLTFHISSEILRLTGPQAELPPQLATAVQARWRWVVAAVVVVAESEWAHASQALAPVLMMTREEWHFVFWHPARRGQQHGPATFSSSPSSGENCRRS